MWLGYDVRSDSPSAAIEFSCRVTQAGHHKNVFGRHTPIHDFIRKLNLSCLFKQFNMLKEGPKSAARIRRMGRLGFVMPACRYAHRTGGTYNRINAGTQAHNMHEKSSYLVGIACAKCPLNSGILIKLTIFCVWSSWFACDTSWYNCYRHWQIHRSSVFDRWKQWRTNENPYYAGPPVR